MEPASSLREPPRPVTGDELLRLPGRNPCELVAGRIVSMTPTSPAHGRIEVNVAAALKQFLRMRNLGVVMAGEVGVFTRWNPDTAVRSRRCRHRWYLRRCRAAGRRRVRREQRAAAC